MDWSEDKYVVHFEDSNVGEVNPMSDPLYRASGIMGAYLDPDFNDLRDGIPLEAVMDTVEFKGDRNGLVGTSVVDDIVIHGNDLMFTVRDNFSMFEPVDYLAKELGKDLKFDVEHRYQEAPGLIFGCLLHLTSQHTSVELGAPTVPVFDDWLRLVRDGRQEILDKLYGNSFNYEDLREHMKGFDVVIEPARDISAGEALEVARHAEGIGYKEEVNLSAEVAMEMDRYASPRLALQEWDVLNPYDYRRLDLRFEGECFASFLYRDNDFWNFHVRDVKRLERFEDAFGVDVAKRLNFDCLASVSTEQMMGFVKETYLSKENQEFVKMAKAEFESGVVSIDLSGKSPEKKILRKRSFRERILKCVSKPSSGKGIHRR